VEERAGSGGSNSLALALKALEEGRAGEAIPLLSLAATLQPDNFAAHYHLGRAHAACGNPERAEASLRQALALRPEDPAALCALGQLLFRRQQHDEARAMLEAALRSDPECSEARATLELLPRPEDRAVLALHLPPSTAPGSLPAYEPRRLLFVLGSMGTVLVVLLLLAFGQLHALRVAPRAPAETAPAVAGAAPSLPEIATTQEPPAEPCPPEVATFLHRVAAAQQRYRSEQGRYATLAELEALQWIDAGAASGLPLPDCRDAVISEGATEAESYTVRATLPDGTLWAIDQEGEIREE
jgi:tetratricopeptide (TPR) repeat protein